MKRVDVAAKPSDLDGVNLLCLIETEVEAKIVLREAAFAAAEFFGLL